MKATSAAKPVSPPREVNVFDFRKAARKRATICPGAGFDYMGLPTLGAFCFATNAATLAMAIGTAFATSRAMLLTTIALIVVGIVLWVYEMFYTLTAWPPAEPRQVKYNPWLGAGIITALLVGFGLATFYSFKLATFGGLHMSPTVSDEEELLFHRLVDDDSLARGTVVLFTLPEENKISEPGKLTLGRIIAVPGDKISTMPTSPGSGEARYLINGEVARRVAPTGSAPIALRVPKSPGAITVPPDCYFIAQDNSDEGYDSRVLGYAKRERILSTKMFRWNKSPFLETIK